MDVGENSSVLATMATEVNTAQFKPADDLVVMLR
jgi:hypothetical protein